MPLSVVFIDFEKHLILLQENMSVKLHCLRASDNAIETLYLHAICEGYMKPLKRYQNFQKLTKCSKRATVSQKVFKKIHAHVNNCIWTRIFHQNFDHKFHVIQNRYLVHFKLKLGSLLHYCCDLILLT